MGAVSYAQEPGYGAVGGGGGGGGVKLAGHYDIDLIAAAHRKIRKNALKYPVSKSKGLAKKYTEL